ncbi:hypothetical protein [Treponema sp. UBA3813]|uniref:hypothetical protein n=1 Tax=Treponema sp. UBA3813 TaxID=1947715 RepID=UPI0025FFA39A|nr:hypothetical protein [Treponema sp. UBA3813]
MKNSDSNSAKLKSLLVSNGLEHCIPLLEEKKLLDKSLLAKMTESDYEKIGITEISDRKKLLTLFGKKEKGCLIPILIVIAIIAGVLILLHYLGILGSLVKIVEGAGLLLLLVFILACAFLFS